MAASSLSRRIRVSAVLASLLVTACADQAVDDTPMADSEPADESGRDGNADADTGAAGEDSPDADEASVSEPPASAADDPSAADVPDDLCAITDGIHSTGFGQPSPSGATEEIADGIRQLSHHYRALRAHLDSEDAAHTEVLADAIWDVADVLPAMIDHEGIDWSTLEASDQYLAVDELFEEYPMLGLPPTALATVDATCGLNLVAVHDELITGRLMRRTLQVAALEMEFHFNDHFEYSATALEDHELPSDAEITVEIRPDSFCLTLEMPTETDSGEGHTILGSYDSATYGREGIVAEPC